MLDFKKIEKFARNLHESVPKIIQDFTYDLDTKIHKILHNQINRMNFISREEFNLQSQILLKTQEQLKQLEIKLKILEKKYKNKFNNYKNENLKK